MPLDKLLSRAAEHQASGILPCNFLADENEFDAVNLHSTRCGKMTQDRSVDALAIKQTVEIAW